MVSPVVCLDLAAQQGGTKRPPHGLEQEQCPKCGSETFQGFGLMGGGFGPYVCCGECDWFYKEQSDGAKPARSMGRKNTRRRWARQGRRG